MKMLKKFKILYFLFLSFIYLNSATLANDNRIENINVIGTQRIDIETVVSYSNTNLGDVYSEELGNQILKDLFNTNLFSNLEISFENNSLLIEVKENPTINLVKFTGNSKIKDQVGYRQKLLLRLIYWKTIE